ncbi:MAG: class I SAM-dependent methyltransferase [Chloroflexi bacterium]|nr:class I SAM-dependent methyltransferase [Chloroflexota bacterium]
MAVLLLIIAAALCIWEFIVCEGAHLGRRFVVWLYDLAATRYNNIKDFDFDWERRVLGEPITDVLSSLADAKLLDVGAGTGRLARTLLALWNFDGTIINLEPSSKMLSLGRSATETAHSFWIRSFAVPLPLASDTFDIVISLEILEFTPNPRKTLAELARVLRPGGWLIVTNRVGWEAKWIFGRTFRKEVFPSVLEKAGLQDITIYPWQVNYDLAWARKPFEITL